LGGGGGRYAKCEKREDQGEEARKKGLKTKKCSSGKSRLKGTLGKKKASAQTPKWGPLREKIE